MAHEHLTLSDLPIGAMAVVMVVSAAPSVRRRLAELGIRPGSSVTTLQRCSGGGRVIGVDQSRVALDRRALASVLVERVSVEAGR